MVCGCDVFSLSNLYVAVLSSKASTLRMFCAIGEKSSLSQIEENVGGSEHLFTVGTLASLLKLRWCLVQFGGGGGGGGGGGAGFLGEGRR